MEKVLGQLKQLGLTEYEGKAYLSLLQDYPVNGYTLSKLSGVPRSRIYEVLDNLKKKQIVFEKALDKSVVYTPLEPELLMRKLRQDFNDTIGSVESYSKELYYREQVDIEPKIIRSRQGILDMLKILIGEAKERIALSIWDEELMVLKPEIDEAISRGVIIRGVYFGLKNPYDEMVSHRRIERYIAENTERYIIAVIDKSHAISGIISRDEQAQCTWSKDPGLIQITDDFIAHDVSVNMYSQLLSDEAYPVYERTLDEIRKTYYGFSDEAYELFPLPK